MFAQDRKKIEITPQYLKQISKYVENLQQFYNQEKMGNLTNEFYSILTSSFSELNQMLIPHSQDAQMRPLAFIKTKLNLEMFCWEKLVALLSKETKEISQIIEYLYCNFKSYSSIYEMLLLSERREKIRDYEHEKDKYIDNLKKEVIMKREYCQELQERVKEQELENAEMMHKLIANAKNTSTYSLSSPATKAKIANLSSQKISKSKFELPHQSKMISSKQCEQTIIQILQSKQKQENIKGKKSNLDNYLKTYFRLKFGRIEMADESESNFREAINYYASNQQKNIFILFLALLEEECEQSYYYGEYKTVYEGLLKNIKRYLNEKQGYSYYELEKMFEGKTLDQKTDVYLEQKDIKRILENFYKGYEIDSLMEIINKMLSNKVDTQQIPCKKLINEILNFELNQHTFKIKQIVNEIKLIDQHRNGYLTFEDIEGLMIVLRIDEAKIEDFSLSYSLWKDKPFTYSEVIEIVDAYMRSKKKA